MQCPNCKYESESTLLKCSHCGKSFDKKALEELNHIDYLQGWIISHAEQLGEQGQHLQAEIQSQRNVLEEQLGIQPMDEAKQNREYALLEAVYQKLPRWGGNAGLDRRSIDLIVSIRKLTNFIGEPRP